MSKAKGLAVLFILLVLPLLVWLFLKNTKHVFERLEIVGSRTPVQNASGGVDTVYHTVYSAYPDFKFANQRGDTLTWDSLKGKIVVADVFFASCQGPCPKLSTALAEMSEFTKDLPEIKYLSISVDPESDSVAALAEYAKRYGANPNQWYFITGDKTELYKLAMNAFFFKADELDSNGIPIFVHDQQLRLIDKEGRIRKGQKFCDGTNPSDMRLFRDELKLLLLEYRKPE